MDDDAFFVPPLRTIPAVLHITRIVQGAPSAVGFDDGCESVFVPGLDAREPFRIASIDVNERGTVVITRERWDEPSQSYLPLPPWPLEDDGA